MQLIIRIVSFCDTFPRQNLEPNSNEVVNYTEHISVLDYPSRTVETSFWDYY